MKPNAIAFDFGSARRPARLPWNWRTALLMFAAPAFSAGCTVETAFDEGPPSDDVGTTQAALAGWNSIQSVSSGKCFQASSMSVGAFVNEALCNDSRRAQKFIVERHPSIPGDNIWRIRTTEENLCVKARYYTYYGVTAEPRYELQLADCDPGFLDYDGYFRKENPVAISGGERTGFWRPINMCSRAPSPGEGPIIGGRRCTGELSERFDIRGAEPPPPPPPPSCPRRQFCCEAQGSECLICAPNAASCP